MIVVSLLGKIAKQLKFNFSYISASFELDWFCCIVGHHAKPSRPTLVGHTCIVFKA